MRWLISIGSLLFVACGGPGAVNFTTYGEEYIEDRIPAGTDQQAGFVDGWELRYQKFLVTFSEVNVGNAAHMSRARVFDLTKKGPVALVAFDSLPANRYDVVSYGIGPATELDDANPGNASADDRALMTSNGYSVYFEATAAKNGVSKSMQFGFALNTQYLNCEHPEYGRGVVVASGITETVQLTIHGDHVWFDDLQSANAKMRFDAIAAADLAPADGRITSDELARVNLTTLPLGQYGTGGASDVKTLKDFVSSLARTIGHYRGEGECTPHVR